MVEISAATAGRRSVEGVAKRGLFTAGAREARAEEVSPIRRRRCCRPRWSTFQSWSQDMVAGVVSIVSPVVVSPVVAPLVVRAAGRRAAASRMNRCYPVAGSFTDLLFPHAASAEERDSKGLFAKHHDDFSWGERSLPQADQKLRADQKQRVPRAKSFGRIARDEAVSSLAVEPTLGLRDSFSRDYCASVESENAGGRTRGNACIFALNTKLQSRLTKFRYGTIARDPPCTKEMTVIVDSTRAQGARWIHVQDVDRLIGRCRFCSNSRAKLTQRARQSRVKMPAKSTRASW